MYYISKDWKDGTYSVEDTVALTNERVTLDYIMEFVRAGLEVVGVTKAGKVTGVFPTIKSYIDYIHLRDKLSGRDLTSLFNFGSFTIKYFVTRVESYFTLSFHNKEVTEFTIPDFVTRLPMRAFEGCSKLKRIRGLENIVEIGSSAFYGCRCLEQVSFSHRLSVLGAYAFFDCSSLVRVDLSECTEVTFGEACFCSCSSLVTVKLPKKIKNIDKSVFNSCTQLKEVVFPAEFTSDYDELPADMFYGCSSLEELHIPKVFNAIDNYCFAFCVSLRRVTGLEQSHLLIRQSAFEGCRRLERIQMGSRTLLGTRCFAECVSLKEALFGSVEEDTSRYASAMSLALESAFANCKSLEDVRLPDTISSISHGSFENCNSLQPVVVRFGSATHTACREAKLSHRAV